MFNQTIRMSIYKPCNLCPYMKKITLEKILDCLENENEIFIEKKLQMQLECQ